jgi:cell division protein ZapA
MLRMPLVSVTVNDRPYTIACDEGEEDHLRELAAHVDAKVQGLIDSVGQAGEQRLLLMAALLIADAHFESAALLKQREQETGELSESKEKLARQLAELEERAVEALDSAAGRIDDIAVRVGRA